MGHKHDYYHTFEGIGIESDMLINPVIGDCGLGHDFCKILSYEIGSAAYVASIIYPELSEEELTPGHTHTYIKAVITGEIYTTNHAPTGLHPICDNFNFSAEYGAAAASLEEAQTSPPIFIDATHHYHTYAQAYCSTKRTKVKSLKACSAGHSDCAINSLSVERYWLGKEIDFPTSTYESGPIAEAISALSITMTAATINGKIIDDAGLPCEYRFRYRAKDGEYLYTEWANGKVTDDVFFANISGLAVATQYEFAAQARNSTEGEWSSPKYFMTLSPRATKPVEDKPTLEHIRNIEVVTGGRFYIDREGKPTYKSRYARNA